MTLVAGADHLFLFLDYDGTIVPLRKTPGRAVLSLHVRRLLSNLRDSRGTTVGVITGHLAGIAADLLYDGREFTEFRADRFHSKHTHGTGCIFASAIAANLAHGRSVKESVAAAKEFITTAIRNGLAIGKGCGPANPMAALLQPATTSR